MPEPAAPIISGPIGTLPLRGGMDRRVAPSRMASLRRWRWPAAGVGVVGAATLAVMLVPRSGTLAVSAAELTVAAIRAAPFQDYLPVRGTIAPLVTVYVDAIEGGQVVQVDAPDGAAVQAGQVLATLSNPQLELDVTSREAAIAGQLGGVSAQRLALQQAQTAQDSAIAEAAYAALKAQRELGVRRGLHAQGFESDAGLRGFADEARYTAARLAALQTARGAGRTIADRQAAEIEATASGLRRNLAVVEGSLQSLELRAPVAGRLTNWLLQPGQTLKQGDQVGQIDGGAYRLDADIDEFYLGRVAEGQRAATIDEAPAQLHVARVKPQVNGGVFRAELVFDGPAPSGLRRGQGMDARLTLDRTRTALVLPTGAWLDGGGAYVFVVDSDGRHARRRAIVSGRRNPEQIEIASGLLPGERVLVSSVKAYAGFSTLLLQ